MSVTTNNRDLRTFRSAAYLANLMAELDRAAISNRIRIARKQAGFTNRQMLADVMQVHWRTIEDWENPKHSNVPWDGMEELASVFNVKKMWLLHGEAEESEDELALISGRLQLLEEQVAESVALTREALVLLRETLRPADGAPRSRRRANG